MPYRRAGTWGREVGEPSSCATGLDIYICYTYIYIRIHICAYAIPKAENRRMKYLQSQTAPSTPHCHNTHYSLGTTVASSLDSTIEIQQQSSYNSLPSATHPHPEPFTFKHATCGLFTNQTVPETKYFFVHLLNRLLLMYQFPQVNNRRYSQCNISPKLKTVNGSACFA